MSSLTIAGLVAIGFLSSLTFDMGLNVFQDYIPVFTNDAFWGSSQNVPGLTQEDRDIEAALARDGFLTAPTDGDAVQFRVVAPIRSAAQ